MLATQRVVRMPQATKSNTPKPVRSRFAECAIDPDNVSCCAWLPVSELITPFLSSAVVVSPLFARVRLARLGKRWLPDVCEASIHEQITAGDRSLSVRRPSKATAHISPTRVVASLSPLCSSMFLNPYHRAYAVVQMDEAHAANQTAHSRHTLETVYQEKRHQRYLHAAQGIELHCAPELLAAKPPPDPARQRTNPLIVRGPCRIDLRKSQESARVSEDGSRPGGDDCQLQKDRKIHFFCSFQPRSMSLPRPSTA